MQSVIVNNFRHSVSCQLINRCVRMTKNGILPSVERTAHTCSSLMLLMQSHQQQCPPLPHCHRCFHSSSFGRFHESHIQCKRGGFISRTGKPPQHGKSVPDQSVAEVEASPPKHEAMSSSSLSSSAETDIVLDETGSGSGAAEVTSSAPDEDSTQAVKLYEEISEMEPGPLLHKVMTNHEAMNKVHFALTMKRLYKVGLSMEPEDFTQYCTDLLNHKGFEVLCSLLALHGEYYKAEIAADMLYFMFTLGVDSGHPAMQVYLQLAKFFINDTSLDRTVKVAISVSEMTPTKQTDVILEGLRTLVPLRVTEETLDSLTIYELVHLFNLYINVVQEGQRDAIINLLVKTYNSEGFSDKYSVLLLDGLRKASARAGLECRPLLDFCIESLLQFMKSNSLNYEELHAALQAYAQLNIYNIDLLNQLTDRFKQTASDLSIRQKLRTLVLVMRSGAFCPELTELFLPDVLERMETLSQRAQENVFQICCDIDCTQLTEPLRNSILDHCKRFYRGIQNEAKKTQLSGDMLVIDTLASPGNQVKMTQTSKFLSHANASNLETRLRVHYTKKQVVRDLLPKALERKHCLKQIQVSYITSSGVFADFIVTTNLEMKHSKGESLAIIVSPHYHYHNNTATMKGPLKCKKYLIERDGYRFCSVFLPALQFEEKEAQAAFLRRHLLDTLEGSVIPYQH